MKYTFLAFLLASIVSGCATTEPQPEPVAKPVAAAKKITRAVASLEDGGFSCEISGKREFTSKNGGQLITISYPEQKVFFTHQLIGRSAKKGKIFIYGQVVNTSFSDSKKGYVILRANADKRVGAGKKAAKVDVIYHFSPVHDFAGNVVGKDGGINLKCAGIYELYNSLHTLSESEIRQLRSFK